MIGNLPFWLIVAFSAVALVVITLRHRRRLWEIDLTYHRERIRDITMFKLETAHLLHDPLMRQFTVQQEEQERGHREQARLLREKLDQ